MKMLSAALIAGSVLAFSARGDEVYLSPGVAEVIKLSQSQISPDVVKSYVKSSSVSYALTADEVIQLRKTGVPDEVVTAMMNRGAELRQQAPAPRQAQPSEYPGAQPTQPNVAVTAGPVIAPYAPPTYIRTVVEPTYVYADPYPYSYSYPYYYPSTSFSFGFGIPFGHYGHYPYRSSYGYGYSSRGGAHFSVGSSFGHSGGHYGHR